MSNELKQIRGQLRQIAKEMLPDLLKTEVINDSFKRLTDEMRARLDVIERLVTENIKRIDDRQKDIQTLMLREMTAKMQGDPEVKPEVKSE